MSANCYTIANRPASAVRSIVWHTLEGTAPGAVSWWEVSRSASAHLIIRRSGEVWLVVPLEHIAWHAGTDTATGRTPFWKFHNINSNSIGVELEGFAGQPFPAEQVQAMRRVSDWLMAHYPILRAHTKDQIDGHHAHSEISNQRSDPGATFKWEWVV